jgi:hypothetical protein
MSRSQGQNILKFIYTRLCPEGYSDNEGENRAYRTHLRKFYLDQCKTLPNQVPLLDFKQIKTYLMRPSKVVYGKGQTVGPEYKYDAFISYRHKNPDQVFARRLLKELEAAGFTIAIDERDFNPAASFLEEMERSVKESRFTLCVLSPRYFESGNAMEEAIMTKVLGMSEQSWRLIPLVTEEVQRPVWLYDIVGIDFTHPDPLVDPMERLKITLQKR